MSGIVVEVVLPLTVSVCGAVAALAAEYRDDQTHEHTQRVGRTSETLAEQLGLDQDFCRLIRHAAPLHDVGKVGIPDTILLKPAKLTPTEFALIREHAAAGARILGKSSSELLKLAEEIRTQPSRMVGRYRQPKRPRRRTDPSQRSHRRYRRRVRRSHP